MQRQTLSHQFRPAHSQLCDERLGLNPKLRCRRRQTYRARRVHHCSRVLPIRVLAKKRIYAPSMPIGAGITNRGEVIESKMKEMPWTIGAGHFGWAIKAVEPYLEAM
jgi:hypothetical protein